MQLRGIINNYEGVDDEESRLCSNQDTYQALLTPQKYLQKHGKGACPTQFGK